MTLPTPDKSERYFILGVLRRIRPTQAVIDSSEILAA